MSSIVIAEHTIYAPEQEGENKIERLVMSYAATTTLPDPANDISSIGITELFEIDERPIFVLDLTIELKCRPVFANQAAQKHPRLDVKIWEGLPGRSSATRKEAYHIAFLEWATSTQPDRISLPRTYCDIRWTAKTLRGRWRIAYGELITQPTAGRDRRRQPEAPRLARAQTQGLENPQRPWTTQRPTYHPTPNDALETQLSAFSIRREEREDAVPALVATEEIKSSSHKGASDFDLETSNRSYDLTRAYPTMPLSPHMQFILDFDWGMTSLGPVDSWPRDLRRAVSFLMSDPRPAALYVGEEKIMLYNEEYICVTGKRHPFMMGKTFMEAWAEIADGFLEPFTNAYETGTSFYAHDTRFDIDREGYLEETYFSLSIIPFDIGNGEVGFYNPVFDTTRQVIADRRMTFLLRLGQYISSARQPRDFWQQLLLGFGIDHEDLPFGMLYSAEVENNDSLSESSDYSQISKYWNLEGLVRVPETCTNIPQRLGSENYDFAAFTELIRADSPTLLSRDDSLLPAFMFDLNIAAGGVPCDSAVFIPIRSTDNILGFLILGVNPKKKYDSDYKVFIELLSRQLASSMASAVLFEEEVRRVLMAAEQAANDRTVFSEKLALQTHEAFETEARFRRMADLAPVGMFHIDPSGTIVYANNDYYTLTEHPRDVAYPMSWYNVILDEDHPIMDIEWGKLLGGASVSFELRLRRPFIAEELVGGEKVEGHTWILAAAYPECSAEGNVVGILGCLTDISRQKWMEGFQTRRMLEAVELKRQQENFIDMTSHEMRNPLSAIVQCADWTATSIAEFDGESNLTIPREVVDGWADAAQTIFLCAQHQKRIIDDILTLSKLDSDLLLITPVEVEPVAVIQTSLKMFDSELQKSDMELHFEIDDSFASLSIEWVKLDPSRLIQVLINLTTNAIKFTQTEPQRKITIRVGASLEPPISHSGVEYLPQTPSRIGKDMTSGAAWGLGAVIYLKVEVSDTGRGLDEHERNLLFKRFSQASPRTHVQYGGSGLGLFISRELSELQGGQIGVSSKAGEGSTFAFYVKARRCDPPAGKKATRPLLNMRAHSKVLNPASLSKTYKDSISKKTVGDNGLPPPPRHVLIVEDNIVNQKVLSKQLRSAGCTVHVANHGVEALSFLETSQFFSGLEETGIPLSVILMDLEMPVMDGLTCVKRIREMETEGILVGKVPVIAVTANARSEQIARAKGCGMDSVVTKPFRVVELIPEIDRWILNGEVGVRKRMGEGAQRADSAPV